MAAQNNEDKTERASPQKLRKSREMGQVARSRDWATAIGILACIKLIMLLSPGYLQDFRHLFQLGFATLDGDGTPDNLWSAAFSASMLLLIKMVLPLFVVPLAVAVASLFPGGWVFSSEHLVPKLERLNPLSYATRMFTVKQGVQVLTSIAKAAAVGCVLWYVMSSTLVDFVHLQGLPLDTAVPHGFGLMLDGVLAMCSVFVVFALIDLPVQHFMFLREQRMSKHEQKEEHKSSEGNPEVRARIRQLQNQLARRSVRKTVPGADVVIVNPEHYAVALKYDQDRAEAPFVIAKGVDEMALYIREIAREHKVEVVPLPPLARAIYNTSQVNQQIPAPLYKAVAMVLGYVLQLRAFRGGQRRAQPQLPDELPVPRPFMEQHGQ
ncbi:MAG TPA: flagellar type III secretion system protein FlhB [Rhodocyclaceae bacterium]|nr:flagellar type III secretion system protein FlhB [Rhodocyclaceae bacterium]